MSIAHHSLDATKATQSTNIINHDKNTTSSDRNLTHVNGGQKKRVGRKTQKHRCLEVAKDTKEASFDARAILPESKAPKPISRLESMKKVVRFPDLRSTFADPAPDDVNPAQDAEQTMKTAPANPISLQPAIHVKSPQPQPATKTKTTTCRQRESPRANLNFEKNRAFTIGLAGIIQQRPVRPVENKNHTASSSSDDVQVLPMKEQKRPRPKINERCRRWLRNECDLGYQCNFVHEDLEYDVPPVSFDLSSCKYSNHVIILTGTQEKL
jgi:hypothetical protein